MVKLNPLRELNNVRDKLRERLKEEKIPERREYWRGKIDGVNLAIFIFHLEKFNQDNKKELEGMINKNEIQMQ